MEHEAHRRLRRWAFLLEILRLTAVFGKFNFYSSLEGFFSPLVVTSFPRWLFHCSNGIVLVTRADSLGMIVESSVNCDDGDGFVTGNKHKGTSSAEGLD